MLLIKFDDLYKYVTSFWPQEINLKVIEHSDSTFTLFSIEGLGELSDDIDSKFIGTKEEVLLREFNDAIYIVVHDLARYTINIKFVDIRIDIVKSIFERRLKKSSTRNDLSWIEEDFSLVALYFSNNP